MKRISLMISCALAAACETPGVGFDEPVEAQEATLGAVLAPVLGRWLQEPVVYRQYEPGATSAEYSQAWQRWNTLGYYPAVLDGARIGASNRYSGVWHKSDRVLDWASHRDQLEADYLDTWETRVDQGYRLIDLDAHTALGVTRYHSVWVREASPKAWRSNRRVDLATLNTNITNFAQEGYRPIRINAYDYDGDIRYAAVWVRDGLDDFEVRLNLSPAQFASLNTELAGDGYVPTDVAPFQVGLNARVAAIWTRDPRVQQAIVRRDLTESALEEANEGYTESNLVMVDLNAYPGLFGNTVYSAIWQRTETRNLVQSNRPTAGDPDLLAMSLVLSEFTTNGNDNRRGTMGFFIQDLQTGNYVTMNADEPFYLASTSKVLIGARVAARGTNLNQQRVLNGADWRGEATRGFTLNSVGQSFPLQTYYTNMLVNSDTASTDVFVGMLASLEGDNGLNDWLRDTVGMQNVGEITSICELDKRISAVENTCVNSVSCDTFEAWSRGAGGPYYSATQAERDCLDSLVDDRSVENHETYYTSLANTVTPAEFGRFWQKLADGDLMTNNQRAAFLATIDPSTSLGFNQFQGVLYDQFGTKNGGKRRVSSQVGIMWDWNGAVGDYTNVTPRYAFSMFTEDWNFEDTNDADGNSISDDTDWALTAMSAVLQRGIQFLANQ